MKVIVVKPFPYAADGLHAAAFVANDELDIHDHLVSGLEREGFVRRLENKPAVPLRAPENAALFAAPEHKTDEVTSSPDRDPLDHDGDGRKGGSLPKAQRKKK